MVVVCRTQQLLSTGKNVNFSKTLQFPKTGSAFGIRNLFGRNNVQLKNRQRNLRLCDCRGFHSSKEPRSSLAKLSPLELLYSNVVHGFYNPNCEYTGMSCLNCYSQKMCLFGAHWSSTDCGNNIAGFSNPYCNPETDQCTNIRPEGCPRITSVSCLRDDVFPDTGDCTVYYQCTNSTAELVPCPNNFIYSQRFGKCVFKLTNDDCVEINGCDRGDSIELYPGDPSLYYGCKSNTFYLEACSPSEFFNTTTLTCESRCSKVGLLAVPQNCSKYYNCEETDSGFVAIERICPSGYGFNPIKLACEKNYPELCNELAILEDDKYDFLSKIPIIRIFSSLNRKFLNLINVNPLQILFIFRLSDKDMSTFILVVDYIYHNKRLPPTIASVLVKFIIEQLPSELQFIYNILSQLGIINLKAPTRLQRSISSHSALQNYLENKLTDIDVDLIFLITTLDTKNASEIATEIFQQITNNLNISEQQLPVVITEVNKHIQDLINRWNTYISWPLFFIDEGNNMRINVDVLDQAINDILEQFTLKLSTDRNLIWDQYLNHREELEYYLHNFYLNLNFEYFP